MEYIYLYAVKEGGIISFVKSEKTLRCDAIIDKNNCIHEIVFEDYVREDEIKNIPEDCFIEYVGFVSYVKEEK